MIYGVGVDLVRVDRIAKAIDRYGERFLARIFTPAEIAYCQSRSRRAVWQFAQRFAAKEAFSKALGVGLRAGGIRWREVEVLPNSMGKPEIHLTGRARELCNQAAIRNMQLSLADEDNHAVAVVVLET
ncbi:MAG: holo-ACP synthase [Deltaproteobacteria bacterium]|nr:holo-ACP synthase [Deltaproteobacteria bacterium]